MSDIFFEPWEGPEYKNQKIKIMILGKEHYCKESHCKDANEKQKFYNESLESVKPLSLNDIKRKIEEMKKLYNDIDKIYTDFCETAEDKNCGKYRDKLYILPDNLISDDIKKKYDIDLSKKIERIISENLLWKDFDNAESEKLADKIKYIADKEKLCPQLSCNLHTSGKCSQLPICRRMTIHEIDSYVNEIKEYKAHKKFRWAFSGLTKETDKDPKNPKEYWNKVLFENFFQCGLPKETNNDHDSEMEQKAGNAIADILVNSKKGLEPDIIITWSDEVFYWLIQNLPFDKITVLTKCHHPKIVQKSGKSLTFTRILWKDKENKEHSCLVLMCYYHPSATRFGKEAQKEFHELICQILQNDNYKKLQQWIPSPLPHNPDTVII